MDRLRKFWQPEQPYERIGDGGTEEDTASGPAAETTTIRNGSKTRGFSYVEYGIFLLLGVSMLWAWNMFLAAGPYFQHRFRGNQWILDNFQAAELSVSTVTNLTSMLILTRRQANASYPARIVTSLVINIIVFSVLAISTAVETGPRVYFAFLMIVMFFTSLAAGFCSNGIYAFVSGFSEPKYTQGIMTGQAIAGVLPCIAQIVSVLAVQAHPRRSALLLERRDKLSPIPPEPPAVPWTAALAYFLTATVISVLTLFAFSYLLARSRRSPTTLDAATTPDDAVDDVEGRKPISLLYLLRKLRWLAGGVFLTFVVTMVFPVFTQRILSVHPPADQPLLLQPPTFIPLALLFWNAGDLIGRLMTAVESLSLIRRPRVVFGLAVSRFAFVGLYHLCNIGGRGAIVNSDVFYLVVVQLFFGLSNGFVGSTCMMGAGSWVEPEEQEATGGFMGLCLVAGLAVGSLLSFFIGGI